MSSVRVKYRKSEVVGKEGSIYYQIIHNRIIRQYSTEYKIYKNEWDSSQSKVVVGNTYRKDLLYSISEKINMDIQYISRIITSLESKNLQYSTDDIISIFIKNRNYSSVFNFMQKLISDLSQMKRFRTSETYASTLKSFMLFRNNIDLLFTEFDSDLMIRYEAYLKNKGLMKNTISFYMRILRAVYNKAIEKEFTTDNSPFKYVYTGIDKTVKRAISIDMVKKLKNLDLPLYSDLDFARDMFMFSFYTRGMSFIDMAYLKSSDIINGTIIYKRRKTGQVLYIKLENCMKDILNKYRLSAKSIYVLQIINCEDGNERAQYRRNFGIVNRSLKKIALLAGFSINLSLYVARHSWASCAKSKNIPISVISEGMGHDSELTTQIYLSSLDYGIIDNANRQIIKSL